MKKINLETIVGIIGLAVVASLLVFECPKDIENTHTQVETEYMQNEDNAMNESLERFIEANN